MPKQKVSATLSPERLKEAFELTGNDSVSELLEQALEVLVERELERRWHAGYDRAGPDHGLPVNVPVDLGLFDPVIEDLVIARRIRDRLATDDGTRLTLTEVATGFGVDLDEQSVDVTTGEAEVQPAQNLDADR